ncbi:MAG: mechanosensitive ion channel family protein [Phycisphaerales bacterium]
MQTLPTEATSIAPGASIPVQGDAPTGPPATIPAAPPVNGATSVHHPASLGELTTEIGEVVGPTFDRTPWHGWAMLLGCILAGVFAARFARVALEAVARRLHRRHQDVIALVVEAAAKPAGLAAFTALLGLGLQGLFLGERIGHVVAKTIALLNVVAFAWFLVGLVALAEVGLRRVIAPDDPRVHSQVVPLVGRALRIFLLVVFILFVAENIFGADISAWLAGLGIAGLAVSLAAQDSVKNLFGSLTVLLDRPFAVGDRIVVDGIDGTVEDIGFRSTKIRTGTGHLITMPNMKFTDAKVENISARGFIRREMNLGIASDTPPEQVETAVRIVRSILADPEIAHELHGDDHPPRVAFEAFAADALNVKAYYWYALRTQPPVQDQWTFFAHAERVNAMILRRFREAGIELALPTRTVVLVNDGRREPPPGVGSAAPARQS